MVGGTLVVLGSGGTRTSERGIFARLMEELWNHSRRLHAWFMDMLRQLGCNEGHAVKECARLWKTRPEQLTGSHFVVFVKMLLTIGAGIQMGRA